MPTGCWHRFQKKSLQPLVPCPCIAAPLHHPCSTTGNHPAPDSHALAPLMGTQCPTSTLPRPQTREAFFKQESPGRQRHLVKWRGDTGPTHSLNLSRKEFEYGLDHHLYGIGEAVVETSQADAMRQASLARLRGPQCAPLVFSVELEGPANIPVPRIFPSWPSRWSSPGPVTVTDLLRLAGWATRGLREVRWRILNAPVSSGEGLEGQF